MKLIWFIPAIVWFIISTILLALPGSDLPEGNFLKIPYFDKLVHLTMFFLITSLFCYPFRFATLSAASIRFWFRSIAFYTLVYGIVMEFAQNFFVAGRSFDIADIFFDALGSFAGLLVMTKFFPAPAKK